MLLFLTSFADGHLFRRTSKHVRRRIIRLNGISYVFVPHSRSLNSILTLGLDAIVPSINYHERPERN